MLRLCLAGDLQDVEGADEVRGHIGLGVFEAVAHAGLGGEMDDDLGVAVLGGLLECSRVLEHAGDGGESRSVAARMASRRSFSVTS